MSKLFTDPVAYEQLTICMIGILAGLCALSAMLLYRNR